MVIALRSPASQYATSEFRLKGLNPDAFYSATWRTEKTTLARGSGLTEHPKITIPVRRASRLIRYIAVE
jgi:hypothetical protein